MIVVIVRAARRMRSIGWAVALGLILGGALGNLVDRFFRAPGSAAGTSSTGSACSATTATSGRSSTSPTPRSCCGAVTGGDRRRCVGIEFDGTRATRRRDREHPRSLPLPDGLDGLRLDVALSRLFGLSRTAAADLVDTGQVLVDGRRRPRSAKVRAGSWLEVTLPDPRAPDAGRASPSRSPGWGRLRRRRPGRRRQAGRRGRAPEPGLDRARR